MTSILSISFIVTFLISLIFFLIKQPLIISYLISGTVISHVFSWNAESLEFFKLFSELGLALLLFLVGLELNFQKIREIGKVSVLIGVLQEIITTILGLIIGLLIGLNFLEALIISLALSFSSTAIVLKVFSDKKELETLHGRLIIGFMIVQDLIAILIFIFLPIIFSDLKERLDSSQLVLSILFIGSFFILNRIFKKLESSLETSLEFVFLLGISYILGVLYVSKLLNLGMEIGALLAGLSLSNLTFTKELISRFRPLRDFFLIIFFIHLGSKFVLTFVDLDFLLKTLIFSIFVIIFNPLIMMLIMRIFKFPKRVNFIVSLSSGQISEFSFILVNIAHKLNIYSNEFVALISLVGIITIFISTYLMYGYEKIYQKFKKLLFFIEVETKEESLKNKNYEVIILGSDRIGGIIVDKLKEKSKTFLVIDYNPEIVKKMKNNEVEVIYGDAEEIDLWEEIDLTQTKLVVSTIPDIRINIFVNEYLKKKNKNLKFICVATRIEEKQFLEKEGVDLVIIPHLLGGEYLAEKIREFI